MLRRAIVAAIALLASGQAWAQTLGSYDALDAVLLGPPSRYLAPPVAFAPPGYFPRQPYRYAPGAGYLPPPSRIEPSPALAEVAPLRPRSCGQYRYWNGEYCA